MWTRTLKRFFYISAIVGLSLIHAPQSLAQSLEFPRTEEGNFFDKDTKATFKIEKTIIDPNDYDEEILRIFAPKGDAVEVEIIGTLWAISTCTSATTQLDQLVVFTCDPSSGVSCANTYIYWDASRKTFDQHIDSVTGEEEEDETSSTCLWEKENEVNERMALWSPKEEEGYFAPFARDSQQPFKMPIKNIDFQTFTQQLKAFETSYADVLVTDTLVENERWQLIYLSTDKICDAEGLVVAFDKKNKKAMGLYHIESGCSKTLNYAPKDLSLKGDLLTGSFCTQCSWWGEWGPFTWDLATHTVTPLPHQEQ